MTYKDLKDLDSTKEFISVERQVDIYWFIYKVVSKESILFYQIMASSTKNVFQYYGNHIIWCLKKKKLHLSLLHLLQEWRLFSTVRLSIYSRKWQHHFEERGIVVKGPRGTLWGNLSHINRTHSPWKEETCTGYLKSRKMS